MNDKSLMPFGKYAGKPLDEVPAKYLIWLYEERGITGALRNYIEDNFVALKSRKAREGDWNS